MNNFVSYLEKQEIYTPLNVIAVSLYGESGVGKTTALLNFSHSEFVQYLHEAGIPIVALLRETARANEDVNVYLNKLRAHLETAYRTCLSCSGKTVLDNFVHIALSKAREYEQNKSITTTPQSFLETMEELKNLSGFIVVESYGVEPDTILSVSESVTNVGVPHSHQSHVVVVSLQASREKIQADLKRIMGLAMQGVPITEVVLSHVDMFQEDLQRAIGNGLVPPEVTVPVHAELSTDFLLPSGPYFSFLKEKFPQSAKLLPSGTIDVSGVHAEDSAHKVYAPSHIYFRLGLSGSEYKEVVNTLIEHAATVDRYSVPIPLREEFIPALLESNLPREIKNQLEANVGKFLIMKVAANSKECHYDFASEANVVKIRWGDANLRNSFNERYMDGKAESRSRNKFAYRESVSDDHLLEKFDQYLEELSQKVEHGPYEFNDSSCVMVGELRSYLEKNRQHTLGMDEKYNQAKRLTLQYVKIVFEESLGRLSSDHDYESIDAIGSDIELLISVVWYWEEREDQLAELDEGFSDFLLSHDLGAMMVSLWDKLSFMIDESTQNTNNPFLRHPPRLDMGDSSYTPSYVKMVLDSQYSQLSEEGEAEFLSKRIKDFQRRSSLEYPMVDASKHLKKRQTIAA